MKTVPKLVPYSSEPPPGTPLKQDHPMKPDFFAVGGRHVLRNAVNGKIATPADNNTQLKDGGFGPASSAQWDGARMPNPGFSWQRIGSLTMRVRWVGSPSNYHAYFDSEGDSSHNIEAYGSGATSELDFSCWLADKPFTVANIDDGQWHTITINHDCTTGTQTSYCYMDGVLVDSISVYHSGTAAAECTELFFVQNGGGWNAATNLRMQYLMVHPRWLEPDEIVALHLNPWQLFEPQVIPTFKPGVTVNTSQLETATVTLTANVPQAVNTSDPNTSILPSATITTTANVPQAVTTTSTNVGDRFVRRHNSARTSTSNTTAADISFDTSVLLEGGYSWSSPEVTVDTAGKYLCIFDIGQVDLSGSARAVGTLVPSVNTTDQTRFRASHRYLRDSGGNHGASIGMAILDLSVNDDVKVRNPGALTPTDAVGNYGTNASYGGGFQMIRLPDTNFTHVERTADATEVGMSNINTTRPWVVGSGTWTKITYNSEVDDDDSLYPGTGGDVTLAANTKYLIVWGANIYGSAGLRQTHVVGLNIDGDRVQTASGYQRDADSQGPPMCGMYLHETGVSTETLYLEATCESEGGDAGTLNVADAFLQVLELPDSAEWIHVDNGATDSLDTALAGTTTWYDTPLSSTFRSDGDSNLSLDSTNDAVQNDSGETMPILAIGWHRWDRDAGSSGTRKMPWTRWDNGGAAVGYGIASAYSRGSQSTDDTWQAHYVAAATMDLANAADLSFQVQDEASGANSDMGVYASTSRYFLGVQVLNLDTLAVGENNTSQLGTATVTTTANVPSAVTTEANYSELAAATVSVTANAPQVVATENNIVSMATGTVTVVGYVPSATTTEKNVSETPSADVTLVGNAPSFEATEHHLSQPPDAAISVVAYAPQVVATEHKISELASATITLTANTLSVVALEARISQLASASVTLTANVPSADTTEAKVSLLESASVPLTAYAPSSVTTEKHISQLGSASLTLTDNDLSVVVTEKNVVELPFVYGDAFSSGFDEGFGGGSIILVPNVPTIDVAQANFSVLPSASVTLTANAPQAVTTEKHISELASASITLTANALQVVAEEGRVVILPASTVTLTANVPQVSTTENSISELASATLTLTAYTLQAVTEEGHVSQLPSADATLTANAPQATATEKHISELPSASVTVVEYALQVVALEARISQLESATVTLTEYTPSAVATEANIVTLPSASVTLSATVPSAVTTEARVSDLPSADLSWAVTAPQVVTTEKHISELGSATITLTANVPQAEVSESNDSEIGSAAVTLTAYGPETVVTEGEFVFLPQAAVTLTGYAPGTETTEKHISALESGTLTLQGSAPSAATTEKHIVELGSASLTLTEYVPQVVSTDSDVSQLPSAVLTWEVTAPQVVTTEKHISELPSAAVTLTGNVPQAVTSESNDSELQSATVTLTAYAPQAVSLEGNTVFLQAAAVTLTAYAVGTETTEKHIVEIPSATVDIVPNAPQVVASDKHISQLGSVDLTVATNAPQAVSTENTTCLLETDTLVLVAAGPTVISSDNQYSTLATALIALTANAPTIEFTGSELAGYNSPNIIDCSDIRRFILIKD